MDPFPDPDRRPMQKNGLESLPLTFSPAATKYVNYRADPHFDIAAAHTAEQSLGEYRAAYAFDDDYPYRMILARHTGMPAQLTGFLPDTNGVGTEDVGETAQHWLAQPVVSRALYGVDWGEIAARKLLRQDRVRRLVNDKEQWSAHVYFQQMLGSVPVYGGQVVCHMTTGTQRAAVTSSYFPIRAESGLGQAPPLEAVAPRALQAARGVLLDLLPPAEALDLYWDEWMPRLHGQTGNAPWTEREELLLSAFIKGLSAYAPSNNSDTVTRLLKELTAAADVSTRVALLRELAQRTRRGPARLAITPYAGSAIFVFPFAGRFYQACRVEYVPTAGTPYRVFVDVESGQAFGEPEALVLFANVYEHSADVPGHPANPAGSPQQFVFAMSENAKLNAFAHVFDKNCNPVDVTRANDEITNVAHHTTLMRDYFVGLANPGEAIVVDRIDAQGVSVAPGLEVNVGLERPGLAMGFLWFQRTAPPPGLQLELGSTPTTPIDPCVAVPDAADGANGTLRRARKLLQFQTDPDGAGLSIPDGRKVFTPSLDPEVIYHEVAHACMWILNPSPFEQNNVNVPFWRALTEGYADYFARSFAARREAAATANANPTQRWAAAAFRAFGDERALARGMNNPHDGQDRLGIANLYPEDQVEAAGTYRVGMIWARALWDIRQFFAVPRNQNAQAPCARSFSARGIADVDRWALHAYMHMAGFVCNFEAAAEAFISEAQRTGQATACEIEHIKSIFLARGIFAERGMQALAAQGNVIAVGADAGVRRFVSNPPSWANPALQDVIALAANQTAANAVTLYAATETGVFKHDNFPNGQWSNLGQWIVGETPICMLFEQNLLFVGTAHGLYSCDPANPQWRAWNPPPGARVPFEGVTFNMTCGELRDAAGLSYRACFVADLSAPLPRPGNGVKLNIMTQNPPLGSAAGTQGALRPVQDLNGWVNLEVIPNVTRTVNGESRVMSGRPTAVALGVIPSNVPGASPSTNLYVGTLGRGVWRLQGILHERNSGLVNQTLTAMPNNIPEGIAVLCLVCDTLGGRNRLLAGTNVGVFEHPIALPNSGWTRLAGLPANAMVRQIAVTAGQPLCVTFNQGLLFHNGVNWQSLSF